MMIPKGCWHEAGSATLHTFEDSHHGETSMAIPAGKSVGVTVAIDTVRIDDVVAAPVRVLKVDVEGAEWGTLKGATKLLQSEAPPHLILELNCMTCAAFDYHPLDLVDWLLNRDCGYRMHLLTGKHRKRLDREKLARLFAAEPPKLRDVWFEPT